MSFFDSPGVCSNLSAHSVIVLDAKVLELAPVLEV